MYVRDTFVIYPSPINKDLRLRQSQLTKRINTLVFLGTLLVSLPSLPTLTPIGGSSTTPPVTYWDKRTGSRYRDSTLPCPSKYLSFNRSNFLWDPHISLPHVVPLTFPTFLVSSLFYTRSFRLSSTLSFSKLVVYSFLKLELNHLVAFNNFQNLIPQLYSLDWTRLIGPLSFILQTFPSLVLSFYPGRFLVRNWNSRTEDSWLLGRKGFVEFSATSILGSHDLRAPSGPHAFRGPGSDTRNTGDDVKGESNSTEFTTVD